jgi:hypothetical protein
MSTPSKEQLRRRSIAFFQRVHALSRVPGIEDPTTATIVFETLGVDVMSGGAAGLTPAILERSQGLPYETARRKLNGLVNQGVLLKTKNGYFLPANSPYWEAYDAIAEELVSEAARLTSAMSSV